MIDHQLLLLGLLCNQEMHGYQINEFIDRQMSFCIDLKRSTAYYLLDKLCREGAVEQQTERAGNRPERHVYRITPAGKVRFLDLLRHNLSHYAPPMYGEDIGILLQNHLPPDEVTRHLAQRRTTVLGYQSDLQALLSALPADHVAVVEHHLLHLDAELRWIATLLERSANPQSDV